MVIFDKLPVKLVLQCFYLPLAAVALLFITKHAVVLAALPAITGQCCGVVLSAGAVIIAKSFSNGKRASAFLCTDCAFTAAGAIFPAITAYMLIAGMSWQSGLAVVLVPVLIVLVVSFTLTFPETRAVKTTDKCVADGAAKAPVKSERFLNSRVVTAGLALCLYLLGQQSFLTWAPTYLGCTNGAELEENCAVVSNYWGPSVFGLLVAAVEVNKIAPRKELIVVSGLGAAITGCSL